MIEDAHGLLRFASFSAARPLPHAFAPATALNGFDARSPGELARLRAAVLPAAQLVATRQRHTGNIAVVARRGDLVSAEPHAPEGCDGLLTSESDVLLAAVAADCPLLFLTSVDGRVAGLFHCGWRGIARGMVANAVSTLRERFDIEPRDLIAAIAPCAGGCCYEVGEEVLAALSAAGAARQDFAREYRRADGARSQAADLRAAIRSILTRAGLDPGQVELAPHCTICGGERFHSYRRSGPGCAHMAAVVGVGQLAWTLTARA